MTEPYTDETRSRWIVQEYHMNAWMLRATLDEETPAQRALAARRAQHPERVYRLVEETIHTRRFVRVSANEAGKPLPEEELPDKIELPTTEGQTDGGDGTGSERGPSSVSEGEAG